MNVKIKNSYVFHAGIWFDGKFYICEYSLNLSMLTNCTDPREQNIALERMNHMIYSVFSNTVFVNDSDQERIDLLTAAGIDVTPLPEQPVDQIVGIALLCKLNSVAESRLIVTDVEIASNQGANIYYCHSINDQAGPFAREGWWHDSSPAHRASMPTNNTVVALTDAQGWKPLDLDWEESSNQGSSNTVVFADFKRDDS